MVVLKTEWERGNIWERDWWGDCCNTYAEEGKQLYYASFMGLNKYKKAISNRGYGFEFDLVGKSVLDIGGGPTSLLLKCSNFGSAVVLDAGEYPEWVMNRYKVHNILYIKGFAEEKEFKGFDEVWIYNVLQHTLDPEAVIINAKKAGKLVRIFEWVDVPVSIGHPNVLTEELLSKHFVGKFEEAKGENCAGKMFYGTYENKSESVKFVNPKKKRFHLLGLAHLATNKNEAIACAFSQKVLKMGTMLKNLGHEVLFYGVEGSTVECDEFIQVSTAQVLKDTYGDYDYRKTQYKHDMNDLAYKTFTKNAIVEINKRKRDGDFLLITFGFGQKELSDAVKIPLTVESGVGYPTTFAEFRVYESEAFRQYQYGQTGVQDGRFYDAVIPNYFDPADFIYSSEKKDYFLYLGRLIKRKGIEIAKETVKTIGGKLIIAGQRRENAPCDEINTNEPYIEYVGFADWEKRRKLLSEAKALFVPTTYIGPFEGVSIEAGFSGTPVITTPWGCFSSNVIHGKTGYRCSTLDHFVWAAKNIDNINPKDCRDFAERNFSMERVAKMYDEYFDMLYTLSGRGWYEINLDRKELDWLNVWYPSC